MFSCISYFVNQNLKCPIHATTSRKKDSSYTLILGDDPGFVFLQENIKSYSELGMIFMIFTGVNHASLPDDFWIEFNEALTDPSVSGSTCMPCYLLVRLVWHAQSNHVSRNPQVVGAAPKEFSHRSIKRMYKGLRVIREEYRPPRYRKKLPSHEESTEQDPTPEATCPPLQPIASSSLQSLSKPPLVDLGALDTQASKPVENAAVAPVVSRAATPVENAAVAPVVSRASTPVENTPTPAENAFALIPTGFALVPTGFALVPTPAVSRAGSPVNNPFATPAVSRASSPTNNPFAHLMMITPTVSRAGSPAWGHRVSPVLKTGRDQFMGLLRSCSASPAVSPEKRARTTSYSLRFTPATSREGSPLLSTL